MIHTDQAISRVRAYLNESGITKSRLAVMAGIPEGCTRSVFSDDWNPTVDTLRHIEQVIPPDFVEAPHE